MEINKFIVPQLNLFLSNTQMQPCVKNLIISLITWLHVQFKLQQELAAVAMPAVRYDLNNECCFGT